MSRAAGIPDDYQGCHLSQIDGYVVSGHVPVETVNRLLSERPDIAGITLPGMPMGSPGMSGVKTEPFTIYEIRSEEHTSELQSLMRISYDVFCFKKKKKEKTTS